MKIANWIFKFIFDPLNILIFLFLWVGVALICADGALEIKVLFMMLMGVPTFLGYVVGRTRK